LVKFNEYKVIKIRVVNIQFLTYIITMKRILLPIVIFLLGMTAYSQDMSYYTAEYTRADSSFTERLVVLEAIRDAELKGIGEFYHEALKFLLMRAPDIKTNAERNQAEKSAIILCEGIAAEKYTKAALELWQTAELFDVTGNANDGNAMRAALVALGQTDGRAFIPHIVQRLEYFNIQEVRDAERRRRIQMGVLGCISALESFKDIRAYRPLFFTKVGPFDAIVKETASNALPNIVDDPSEAIIAIIQDPRNEPPVKLLVWREMDRTKMPNDSKAKIAAASLSVGWLYQTSNKNHQTMLRELRKSAIDLIGQIGVSEDSVYINLEKSYRNNFISNSPDFDEIIMTLNTLAAVKTDHSVNLLLKFLQEINGRRRSGPWGNTERRIFELLTTNLGKTGSKSVEVRLLLTTISRNSSYTSQEQTMAANALKALTQ